MFAIFLLSRLRAVVVKAFSANAYSVFLRGRAWLDQDVHEHRRRNIRDSAGAVALRENRTSA